MRTLKILILLLFSSVAIGQTITQYQGTPSTLLDNRGYQRIRQLPTGLVTDSVLVVNNGVIKKVLRSSVQGSPSHWTLTGNDIYNNNTGRVLIGSATGTAGYETITKLDVTGGMVGGGGAFFIYDVQKDVRIQGGLVANNTPLQITYNYMGLNNAISISDPTTNGAILIGGASTNGFSPSFQLTPTAPYHFASFISTTADAGSFPALQFDGRAYNGPLTTQDVVAFSSYNTNYLTVRANQDIWIKDLDDLSGVAKVVTSTNGVLGNSGILPGTATLTATQIGYGSAGNTLTGDATLTYLTTSQELRLLGTIYKASLVFSNYSSIGSLQSGAGFYMGTGVKASFSDNGLVKLNNDDAHFFYTRYDIGLTFNTGITGAAGSAVPDNTNIRMRISPLGLVSIAERSTSPSTAPSNEAAIYPKSNGLWYGMDDAGAETPLSNIAETASNGLTKIANDIQLGGALTAATIIAAGANNLTISTSTAGVNPLTINSNTGVSLITTGTDIGILTLIDNATANSIHTMIRTVKNTTGTAAVGLGASIEYILEHAGGANANSNSLISKWTNAGSTTFQSQFDITGATGGAAQQVIFSLRGDGRATLPKYGINTFTGTAAYNLAVDASGNIIEVAAGGGGGANSLGTYLVQTATNAPANAQIMGSLSTGLVKNTTTTGVQSIAVAGTDYIATMPTLQQVTTAGNSTTTDITVKQLFWNNGYGSEMGRLTASDFGAGDTRGLMQLTNGAFSNQIIPSSGTTANWTAYLPNATGTIALQSWVTSQGYSTGTGASNLALGTATASTLPITNSNGTGFTLPTFTTTAGLVPGTATSTTNFLRADGTWASPNASGSTWNGTVFGTSYSATSATIDANATQWTFTGSTAATFTLPSFAGSVTNRFWFVKNAGTANLTVSRAGTDNLFTSTTVTSVVLAPGESASFSNAATSTANLWTVLFQSGISSETDPTALHLTGAETVAGIKTWSNRQIFSADLELAEIAAPGTPNTGFGRLYMNSADSKPYVVTDGGLTYDLTAAALFNSYVGVGSAGGSLTGSADLQFYSDATWGKSLDVNGEVRGKALNVYDFTSFTSTPATNRSFYYTLNGSPYHKNSAGTVTALGGSGTEIKQEFTGSTASTLALTQTPLFPTALLLFYNGLALKAADYSISGTTVTLNFTRTATDLLILKYSY